MTVFTKNRERLLKSQVADGFFQQVMQQARPSVAYLRSLHVGRTVDRSLGRAQELPTQRRQGQATG